MPRLRWSQAALLDVARLHGFLAPKSRDAAKRSIKAIRQGVKALGKHPEIGRPIEELPLEFREWVIEFVSGAYIALVSLRREGDRDIGGAACAGSGVLMRTALVRLRGCNL